jgi:hypothetical protein
MTPPKCEVVLQNAEDVLSLLKAISAAESVEKSTFIEAVKASAEAELHRLLADLGELRKEQLRVKYGNFHGLHFDKTSFQWVGRSTGKEIKVPRLNSVA